MKSRYQRRRAAITAMLVCALLVPTVAYALGTAVVSVGGGTWSYGTTVTTSLQKRVWSNYYHGSRYHTSTAKLGKYGYQPIVDKDTAPAGVWSYASVTGPLVFTGYAYWDVP